MSGDFSGTWNYKSTDSINLFFKAVLQLSTGKDLFFYPEQRSAPTASQNTDQSQSETEVPLQRAYQEPSPHLGEPVLATYPQNAQRHLLTGPTGEPLVDGNWRKTETLAGFPVTWNGRIPYSEVVGQDGAFRSEETLLAEEITGSSWKQKCARLHRPRVKLGHSHKSAQRPQSLSWGPWRLTPAVPPLSSRRTPCRQCRQWPKVLPLRLPHRWGTRRLWACHHLPPVDQSDVWPSFHFKLHRRDQPFGVHIGGRNATTHQKGKKSTPGSEEVQGWWNR